MSGAASGNPTAACTASRPETCFVLSVEPDGPDAAELRSTTFAPAGGLRSTSDAATAPYEMSFASSASAGEQAALQQQYAAADRTIESETFVAPDLTTPEARRAARRAGVDIDRFIARSQRR